MIGRLLSFSGLLVLLHAAYSANHRKSPIFSVASYVTIRSNLLFRIASSQKSQKSSQLLVTVRHWPFTA